MTFAMNALLKLLLFPSVLAHCAEMVVHPSETVEGEDFVEVMKPPERVVGVARGNGQAEVSNSFIRKVVEKAGMPPFLHSSLKVVPRVQTSMIYETTPSHVDYYPPNRESIVEPVGEESLVAFAMLNTNDEAHFSHGETCIPIKEGTLRLT